MTEMFERLRSKKASWGMGGFLVFVCFLLFLANARAQRESAEPTDFVIRTRTDVVNVVAVVRDRKGGLIGDLERTDFEIYEDGVRREVGFFSREVDTPLTIGLLIDTSGSVAHVLGSEKEHAKAFFRRVLRPIDLAFVMSFDSEVFLLRNITSDVERLMAGIDSAALDPQVAVAVASTRGGRRGGGFPGPPTPPTFPTGNSGGTHFYDALYLAATEQLAQEVGRRVLIVLSDGDDQGSRKTLEEAIESVQKSDTVMYGLPFGGRFTSGKGRSVLGRLSRQTGGRVISVRRAAKMGEAFEQISQELRTQYSLGFYPNKENKKPGFRKIEVRIPGQKYKIQARRGYFPAVDN